MPVNPLSAKTRIGHSGYDDVEYKPMHTLMNSLFPTCVYVHTFYVGVVIKIFIYNNQNPFRIYLEYLLVDLHTDRCQHKTNKNNIYAQWFLCNILHASPITPPFQVGLTKGGCTQQPWFTADPHTNLCDFPSKLVCLLQKQTQLGRFVDKGVLLPTSVACHPLSDY